MRATLLAVIAAVLTASTASSQSQRDPQADARLHKYLDGRVARETVSCLPVRKTNDPIAIDDRTLLFRDGPRIWRNDLIDTYQCGKIDRQSVIISESRTERLCRGDKLVFTTGMLTGACVLGDFTLYKKP